LDKEEKVGGRRQEVGKKVAREKEIITVYPNLYNPSQEGNWR